VSTTAPKWIVVSWQEQDGAVYCCDVMPGRSWRACTEFNKANGGTLSDNLDPRTPPLFTVDGSGDLKETIKVLPTQPFQRAIDAVQRMMAAHRP